MGLSDFGGAGETRTHAQGIMSGPDVGACDFYLHLCPQLNLVEHLAPRRIDSISLHERHHAAGHGVLPASLLM